MRIASFHRPGFSFLQRDRVAAGPLLFAAVALLTLLVELALVERKFAIFAGGFGQSRPLDAPSEILAFAIGIAASHLLFLFGLYRLIARLHGRGRDRALFLYNFAFFVPGVGIMILAAKFKVLSYFSDAISFQLIRNLGGGSLFDAALYALSDAGLFLFAGVGLVTAYTVGLRLLRRYSRPVPPQVASWVPVRVLATACALFPILLFAVNKVGDTRPALARFNSYLVFATVLGEATDFDRDGYSWFSSQIDTHPFDASRHPLALDIPGNGIDEDGFGGDFALAPPEPAYPTPALPLPRKHVILIVLESTRGDVIGERIGGRPVAPNLEALARSGTLVPEAYSHVGFTSPSLKSLFGGSLDPARGGPSLFRDFKANGYRTATFSGQSEDFGGIADTVGMRRWGDIFVDAGILKNERASSFAAEGSLLVDGQILLREFNRRLGSPAQWQRPNFIYFNFQSAHFPYSAPGMKRILPGEPIPRGEINASNKARVASTYWNAVAYNDWLIGKVIARLKALGVYENSVILVTADHGESLFDDGFLGHGHMLNRQQTHIPLVLSPPGLAVRQPVGLDDIRVLLLGALGAKPAPNATRERVFQYIGDLDRPAAIGLVEPDGERVTLDLETRMLWSSDAGPPRPYDQVPGGPLASRAARLIGEWESARWRQHVGLKATSS